MRLIDTHCHLYLKEFAGDIGDIIQRAEKEGVEKFYLPAIDSSVLDDLLALEKQFPGKCIGMIGPASLFGQRGLPGRTGPGRRVAEQEVFYCRR